MPDVAVPTVPPLSSLRRVDLVHTGSWAISSGEWNPSREDLVQAVAAMDCPAVRRPVLKLGHSQGEQPLWAGNPTGAPAVGWVDNLALENQGHTLVGDFVGMPGWLGDVAASAYPDRSVEGKYDFRCQIGHTHPFVLTAVALLGVTPPGVGTLRSLQDVGRLYGVEAGTVVAFDPNQPRWPDGAPEGLGGQWRDETPDAGNGRTPTDLPDSVVTTTLKTAAGPEVEIRTDQDGMHIQYGSSRSGGLDRRAAERLSDLLGRVPSDNDGDGRVVDSAATYSGGPDSPPSGFAQVVREGRNVELELLNNEDRLQLTSVEARQLADIVDRYAVARRVDTDAGPVDLWLDGDKIGVRAPADNGGHVELSVEPADWARIESAVNLVWEGFDEDGTVADPEQHLSALRVNTRLGPLLVRHTGEEPNDTLSIAPDGGGWLIQWPADSRHPFSDATSWLEETADALDIYPFSAYRRLRGVSVVASAEVRAHMRGRHDQSSHGNRYGPGGRLIRRGGRLVRITRRQTVRALDDVLDGLADDESANRPGMTGGPLIDLLQGIRDGVDGGQFTPDQALQLLSSLVFRPDVSSNPTLSTALARATGRLRGVQAAAWDEADHPRDRIGRFSEKGGFARTTLNLAEGDLDVDDVEGEQVRLGIGDIDATLEPDAANDLIDTLRQGLDDGFELDVDGVVLSRDGDTYHLDFDGDTITLSVGELDALADAVEEARRPRATADTSVGELRAKVDSAGDINLRFEGSEDTDLSPAQVQELVDGLDDLLNTDIPDDAASGDLVDSLELESGVDLAMYGNGVVSIGWDGDSDRIEVNLDPDDVEPVREALQQVLEGAVVASADVEAADGDDNQLKHYWTRDPRGLARWATHPHPWTALFRQLRKHVGAERARRIASQWFHDVFGIWPGERFGDNPAGPG